MIFNPVMAALEKLTYANMRKDGSVPSWVALVVRSTVALIWFFHDWIFAPLFGRGDGLDQNLNATDV